MGTRNLQILRTDSYDAQQLTTRICGLLETENNFVTSTKLKKHKWKFGRMKSVETQAIGQYHWAFAATLLQKYDLKIKTIRTESLCNFLTCLQLKHFQLPPRQQIHLQLAHCLLNHQNH